MSVIRKLSNLISKLVALNSLIVFVVIIIAGFSLKNYACFLVNSENVSGEELVDLLNQYFWKVGVLAFLTAGALHFLTVKKIFKPIKRLTEAVVELKEGKQPKITEKNVPYELKELVVNFNSMSATLQTIQEQRDEMLRDIAHELRTPLTNINGYLEALQNEVIEGDPELFCSLLEESRRITSIVELITELNTWSHRSYFSDKQFEALPIHHVLDEAVTAFTLKLKSEFVNFHFERKEGTVVANKDGLMQVFSNVLQNILDYNIGKDLYVNGVVKNKYYLITFRHTGQFIDPSQKEKIFERFYRVDESRSSKSDGAGLGLAISRGIIAAHHGTIEVDTDGHQHTFTIKIPTV